MCRWLAYSGDALQISRVVLDTNHSLVAQSLNSPLGAETVLAVAGRRRPQPALAPSGAAER